MFLRHLCPVFCALIVGFGSSSIAQEAFIDQVGAGNTAANFDGTSANLLGIVQQGEMHSAVQLVDGRRNAGAIVQTDRANAALHVVSGSGNLVGSAQFGNLNSALTTVIGNRNTVGTLQYGQGHVSSVNVSGNDGRVSVAQFGQGRESQLTVIDNFNGVLPGSMGNPSAPTVNSNPNGGLDVNVFQQGNDAPVNARVWRQPDGTLMIQPGLATTVLTFNAL